ncbi:contact-dependent growth inhibition system immunity protein [Streptomyces sp. AD681]|uniref:contact-dependent growth inhibition system immunity protein n=1 Tax=Streptomyces sp. AD681 TaxID=3019069 RepID=UPI0022F1C610|nr:contact-dependent growth inhibition system immunity protein [Streptomyces sp. AD681]MDA5141115.1 contact-dependent growth inhibition system immunity protein [Streptomyces sp. AD681]
MAQHSVTTYQFLGSYSHQDFFDEYASHSEAVDDYLAGASQGDRKQFDRDITSLLALAGTEGELKQAVSILGMEVSPPQQELTCSDG